jgi:MIP family channel proteins
MSQTWMPNAIAEAVGAFALVFVVVLAMSNGASLTGVALAAGLAIAVMVAALGHVSGGHFNPGVTFAFLLARRINGQMAGIYWAAQFIGGILASVLVALLVSRDAVAAGSTVLADDVNVLQGILLEAVATFFLVLVVFGTVLDRRAPVGAYPLAIGLTITIGIFAIGPLTGGSLNAARSFGPALVGGEWGGIVAWLIGPVLGAALAWAVYEYVLAPQPEVAADSQS